jgi:hypothetical protein
MHFSGARPVGGLLQDNFDDLQAVIAPDWLPLLVTPSFPSHTSGHSTQSGAVATVLTDMFGLKAFTDTTHRDHGLTLPQTPRTFHSLRGRGGSGCLAALRRHPLPIRQ